VYIKQQYKKLSIATQYFQISVNLGVGIEKITYLTKKVSNPIIFFFLSQERFKTYKPISILLVDF